MPLSCYRRIQKVLTIKRTYSDLKFDVKSIGDGFGTIGEVPRATNVKNSILSIFSWTYCYTEGTILDEIAWNFVRSFSTIQSTNLPKDFFFLFSWTVPGLLEVKIRPKNTYFWVYQLTPHNFVWNFVADLMLTKKWHNRVFVVIGLFGHFWQPHGPKNESWA